MTTKRVRSSKSKRIQAVAKARRPYHTHDELNLVNMPDEFDMTPLYGGCLPKYRGGKPAKWVADEARKSVERSQAAKFASSYPPLRGTYGSLWGRACDLYGLVLNGVGVSSQRRTEHLLTLYVVGPRTYLGGMRDELKKEVLPFVKREARRQLSSLSEYIRKVAHSRVPR